MLGKALTLKQFSNYLIVGLFVFALTSFSLTYWVFPSYAAPTVTTFMSCETSDGCGFRYNDTQYLLPLPNNMTMQGNWSTSGLIFQMAGNETLIINGSSIQRTTPFALLHLAYTPAVNGTMGIHVIMDLNGQTNVEGMEIEVDASSLAGGNPTVYSALVNTFGSTGGTIHAFHVSIANGGAAVVEALGVFSGIVPIHQHSGSPANMDRALIYDGSFSDVTAAFTATGNDTSMFVSVDDSVYIGHASMFSEIQFNLDTEASGAGIVPVFEFSTGGGGWTIFSPIDGTDGMRDSASIAYEPSSLSGWATDTVSGFGPLFWVRINRTQVGLGIVPIEDLVQIVVGTEFTWDASGNVQIFGLNVTQNLRVTGTSNFNDEANFNAKDVLNLGNVGNDFQAAGNSLIATAVTGLFQVENGDSFFGDIASGAFLDIGSLGSPNGFIDARGAAADVGLGFRTKGGGSFIFSNTVNGELLVIAFTGVTDFKNKDANNLGAAGNDLLAAGNTLITTSFSGDITIPLNNTLSLYSDAVRVADAYFVVSHVKSQVTDLQLEAEYKPNPFEVFNNGDVVCLKEWKIFTKCDSTYNKILGPIFMLRVKGITGIENITSYNMEIIDDILKNVSSIKQVDKWGIIDYEPVIVVEGPYLIKTCVKVFEGQLLIAGNDGCIIGVNSYLDVPPLMLVIGYAAYDSKGGYVEAVIL